jgi:CMP-N,N'-diacetyllegionaminic acid synthase
MTRLALIPARGGSKGIPGKNLAAVGGRSLLARAVECALATNLFHTVLVSTDDEAIAAEGRRAGAQVPFLRPADLAGDAAPVIAAIRHAVATLEAAGGPPFDLVALLEPTSPLRTPDLVRQTIAIAETEGFDAALTVSTVPTRFHPLKQFRPDARGCLVHHSEEGSHIVARQQLRETFVRNGLCYATRRSALDAGHGVLGRATGYLVVPGPIVNIDDPEDLELARRLVESPAHLPLEKGTPS